MTLPADTVTKLAAPLDAGRVKTRESGRGPALSYLETHDVIRTANDVFGFGNWGHEIVELRALDPVVVHNREQKAGLQVGYVCVIRLAVGGCVPVSGVGYGDAVEYRESSPVTAHELAAKEAESDALKRALKNYGDQFGLALYDKSAAENGHITTTTGTPPATRGSAATITEPQQKRLFAIANAKGVSADTVRALVFQVAGVEKSSDVPKAKYDTLVAAVEAAAVTALDVCAECQGTGGNHTETCSESVPF